MISLFKTVSQTTPEKNISVDDFLHAIRYGKWKEQTEKCRAIEGKEARSEYKKTIPAVTVSGTFAVRREPELVAHSGFICIDIDAQEVPREKLCADPYTYALFTSISGNGCAILVRVNPGKHKESFYFLQNHYFESYGVVVDPAPSNVASARIVSYDPTIFINSSAKTAKTKERKSPRTYSLPTVFSDDDISDLVRRVVQTGKDIAPDYVSYRNLAFALAAGCGEAGRQHFHTLCQTSDKYHPSQADAQYTACLKAGAGKITIGSFYHMAKEIGVALPQRDQKPVAIAAIAKKSGRTKEAVTAQLVEINHLDQPLAAKIAEEVFARPDITLKTLASDPEHLIESLVNWMRYNHPMRKNLITDRIENNTGLITTEKINTIYLHARGSFNTPQVSKDLIESIIYSDHTPEYNPFHAFYRDHGSHTSTGHISALIASVSTPTTHAATFLRKWLISIHAAIDGKPDRTILVLVGPQFNGKTEFFRRLLPTSLLPYYSESKMDRGKDDELLMCQNLIVMDDEMGGKSKQDEKKLKELASKKVFTLRAAYRRDNQDYKRLAVLCGTSNPVEIMNDPTGNTRILPIFVNSIDYAAYNAVDKTALFMEAYRAYQDGEEYQLTRDDLVPLSQISDDFSATPYERELVLRFFRSGDTDRLTATEIKDEIELNSKQQIRNLTRLGIELRKIFGDPIAMKRNGSVVRCYPCTKISGQGQPGFPQNDPPF